MNFLSCDLLHQAHLKEHGGVTINSAMKKTSFATHLKEMSLVEGGSRKVQMTIEDIKPGEFYVR